MENIEIELDKYKDLIEFIDFNLYEELDIELSGQSYSSMACEVTGREPKRIIKDEQTINTEKEYKKLANQLKDEKKKRLYQRVGKLFQEMHQLVGEDILEDYSFSEYLKSTIDDYDSAEAFQEQVKIKKQVLELFYLLHHDTTLEAEYRALAISRKSGNNDFQKYNRLIHVDDIKSLLQKALSSGLHTYSTKESTQHLKYIRQTFIECFPNKATEEGKKHCLEVAYENYKYSKLSAHKWEVNLRELLIIIDSTSSYSYIKEAIIAYY